MIFYRTIRTRLGSFRIGATLRGLYSLEYGRGGKEKRDSARPPAPLGRLLNRAARDLSSFLSGGEVDFLKFPVDPTGWGPFERKVLRSLRKVPRGRTETYQVLARRAGNPRAMRAVGQILGRNRLPFVIPCHRIVPKRGGLGGFSGGVRWKRRLLKLEGSLVDKIA